MKYSFLLLFSLALGAVCPAANIVWISDQLPIGSGTTDHDGGASGIFGPGAGPYPDEGFITLLSSAGHTVTRFNPSNTTPLNAADIAALNASDLLIIGRSIGSGSFDSAAETLPWNTLITKPLLVTNTYISRSSRLGWYASGPTQSDVVSNPLTFTNPADAVSTYLIDGISMAGSTTTNSMTEAIIYPNLAVDIRGISLITDPVVAGATVIASSAANAASTFIASWPAGTTLAGTSSAGQVLSGYRMQYLAGNRESATAPNNTVGSAGFENFTPDGEGMFLRAVTVAINNGAIPEPASAALLALAALSVLRRRRS
ncbi:MAG: PEP-CTERM sorting domain-containing protein [Verrucomicrobiales bacterium]